MECAVILLCAALAQAQEDPYAGFSGWPHLELSEEPSRPDDPEETSPAPPAPGKKTRPERPAAGEPAPGGPAPGGPDAGKQSPAPGKKAAKREAPSSETVPGEKKPRPAAPKKTPPERVKLPEAGEHPARDLLDLAAELWGRPLSIAGSRVAEKQVMIRPDVAGQRAGREEVAVLLASHGIYLFPHEGRDGPMLVASADPHWTPERDIPRFIRSFQVRARDFEDVAEEVESYLAEKNRAAPGEPPATAAIDPRSGRIIVRATSERIIAGVDEIIARREAPGPAERHLHTYAARHVRVDVLRDRVLDELSEGEAKRISLVVPARRNVLLIGADDDLYRKVEAILKARDVPQRARTQTVKGSRTRSSEG